MYWVLNDRLMGLIDKAVLVGHSMGCLVAANLAEKLKERIVASVWIGPVYPGEKLAEVFR